MKKFILLIDILFSKNQLHQAEKPKDSVLLRK